MFQLADPLFHRFLSGSWRTPVVVFAAVDEVSFPLCFFVELVGKTVDPAGSQYFGIDTVFSQCLSYGNAFALFFVSQLFEFFRERQGVSRNAPDYLLHNIITESCKTKMENVASPKWRKLQPC